MAQRWQSPAPVLSALLLGACLVQDVELVDSLPGAAGGGGKGSSAGASSTAGSANEGGEDPGAAGGDSGGSDSGGSAGNAGGGSEQGGSGGSDSSGSAGMNQGGTGMGTPSDIPAGLLNCDDPNYYLCDTFEDQLASQWPPGTAAQDIVNAPSGSQGLIVNYTSTHTLPVDLDAFSASFWVRFPSLTDQRFVSFQDVTTLQEFGFGLEHERARWIYPHMSAATAVVPEVNSLTRLLSVDTWVCVQLRVDLSTFSFDASVVVPGDAPVALPVLDKNPTTGADEVWNTDFPDWTANGMSLIFGQAGVYQEIDDVLVGDYDAQTLCEKFAALGPD